MITLYIEWNHDMMMIIIIMIIIMLTYITMKAAS